MISKAPIWHNLNAKDVLEILETSEKGLTEEEVKERRKRFGFNKLPEKKPLSKTVIFLSQFKSPLVYILLIAVIISFLLKGYIDALVILGAVFLNTIVGFFQENKAETAISQLKKMVTYKTKVIRDGIEKEKEISELVPGDIILLKAGDRVPADIRLIEAQNLQVSEAALTGESIYSDKKVEPLEKGMALADRENMCYLGTVAEKGIGKGVAVAIAERTELGKIASLIKETKEEKTPLQNQIAHFARILAGVIVLVSALILILGIWQGRDFIEMFTISVAVAVAAIPEGLLVSITVILAIGMQKILKEKALVRKLIATETLGSITVICSDKTGTLTQGKMEVAHILSDLEDKSLLLKIGSLCNDAIIENPEDELEEWKIIGDPLERALLIAASQADLSKAELDKEHPRIEEIPFDAEKKFMATLNEVKSTKKKDFLVCVKGAPEIILEMSSYHLNKEGEKRKLDKKKIQEIKSNYENLAGKGLRIIALAYKKTSVPSFDFSSVREEDLKKNKQLTDLIFLGFAALKDPLRSESKETIKICHQAGIRVVIVTGDHKLTTQTIANEIGLPAEKEDIIQGEDLDKLSDQELEKVIKRVNIYTRVEPRHKIRIVDALQARNEVVAMTGDGVNDAPALKSSDIGVALGSGTDIAKETSDIIILDDNFSTIVKAIRQGRIIFSNIRKVILYLMSGSFTEIILISASLFLGLPLPILAAQILWINLVEDTFPALSLAFEPAEEGLMRQKPRRRNEPILNLEIKVLIFIISIITVLITFSLFWWFIKNLSDLKYARTVIFVAIGIISLFYTLSCRSLKKPFWQINFFSNKYLIYSLIFGILMIVSAVYLPALQFILRTVALDMKTWGIIIALTLINILLIEITKWFFIAKDKKRT
ncbi:MAG: Ca2+-transporting ATPase [Parcubacteria group bacterium Athens1014_10]|nr:MAG: Ca2+-transporting ATPase [Parcubacteria group bacterium Athens1014_10]TSD04976.1 MAG: Ca2+-transporting ATPase [Parcubacteria group bacterium Athens0714_12]